MSRACTSEFVSIGQANLHEQEERQLGMRMQVGLREHEVRSNPRLEERADTSEPCLHGRIRIYRTGEPARARSAQTSTLYKKL